MFLSGVRIAGSRLDFGKFSNVNFCGADLSQVNFRQAFLVGANFARAIMDQANFGENPNLEDHSGPVLSMVYS